MLAPSPNVYQSPRLGIGRRRTRVGAIFDGEIARLVHDKLSLPEMSVRLRLNRVVIERRIALLGLTSRITKATRCGRPFDYAAFAEAENRRNAKALRAPAPRSPRRVVETLAQADAVDLVPVLHACGFTLDMIQDATGVPPVVAVAAIRAGGPRPC